MVLGTNREEWKHFLFETMPLEMHRPVCFQPGLCDTPFSPVMPADKVQIFFYFSSEESAEALQSCIANKVYLY